MKKVISIAVVVLLAVAGMVSAAEISLQAILDRITVDPIGDSSVSVPTDRMPTSTDWLDVLGEHAATMVIEVAGYKNGNVFGIYDVADVARKQVVFAGPDGAGTKWVLDQKMVEGWSGFGFYLTNPNAQTFYSNPALNPARYEYFWAFQGEGDEIDTRLVSGASTGYVGTWDANGFMLAWEDVLGGGDRDHNDMVIFARKNVPAMPVPDSGMTVAMLGAALMGLGVAARRMR